MGPRVCVRPDARFYVSAMTLFALFRGLFSLNFYLLSWRLCHVCALSCEAPSFCSRAAFRRWLHRDSFARVFLGSNLNRFQFFLPSLLLQVDTFLFTSLYLCECFYKTDTVGIIRWKGMRV